MTTTQIELPNRISITDYVKNWANETELGFHDDEIAKITSGLVNYVNRVLAWRLAGQVRIASSGPILAEDSDVPEEQIIRIVVEAVEGFDLFGLVDPDA
jgi:hypothetical protein